MKNRILALVGAQYGSEGKGKIAHLLADEFDVHVRTGGPNAGHSFYHEGERVVMQSIPCGWTNPNAMLIVGRGALVEPALFARELEMVEKLLPGTRERVFIDGEAGVISPWHREQEGGTEGEIHHRIGSTGKGVGAARRDLIGRREGVFLQIREVAKKHGFMDRLADTVLLLHAKLAGGSNVLLEGAQGSGLSLTHGPWPYVTSADTNAAQMAADAGLPPQLVTETMLVARTLPIRVWGNSGPMYKELTWEEVSRRAGREVREKTTVTKKVRRIGEWDTDLVQRAILLNRPSSIALTFVDYLEGCPEGARSWEEIGENARRWIVRRRSELGVPFGLVSTGPLPGQTIDYRSTLAEIRAGGRYV